MKKPIFYTSLALLGVLLALTLPRITALDRFVTPDEPKWLMRSANFYLALTTFDLKNTYQHEHPGVTVTWAGTAGFLRRFPLYVNIHPGQIERAEKLLIFFRNNLISPMPILAAGRFFVVIFIVFTVSLAFLVGSRLLGLASAFIGFTLIAFDPFFAALSRLLHVDGLVSALMLLAALAYLAYLYDGRRKYYLLISGVAAGLSWLTKSPAIFLIPFIGMVALMEMVLNYRSKTRNADVVHPPMRRVIWMALAPALGWLVIACATFMLFWPAMWVNPLETIKNIFSQALVYAAEGHENISFFNGQVYGIGESAWYFYPISFAWRASPVVLIGLGLALWGMIFQKRLGVATKVSRAVLYLFLYAVFFLVAMSLGEKKFDRYLLPSHLALDLIAGFGWVTLVEGFNHRLEGKLPQTIRRLGQVAMYSGLIAWQLSGILQTYPYYLNYYNPLLGGSARADRVMMVGWGEGLDQAASYLNELPAAEKLNVVSWYGNGSLSYLFNGKTINMEVDTSLDELRKADYAVLYINQVRRQLPNPEILSFFYPLTPIYVVKLGGLEYAWIYDLR